MSNGPSIKCDGKRPYWLRDNEFIDVSWLDGTEGNWAVGVVSHHDKWPVMASFSLCADHPYYRATKENYLYWPGGKGPPDHWDGLTVLSRNGKNWGQNSGHNWEHSNTGADIIGYKTKFFHFYIGDTVRCTSPKKAGLERHSEYTVDGTTNSNLVVFKEIPERKFNPAHFELVAAGKWSLSAEELSMGYELSPISEGCPVCLRNAFTMAGLTARIKAMAEQIEILNEQRHIAIRNVYILEKLYKKQAAMRETRTAP